MESGEIKCEVRPVPLRPLLKPLAMAQRQVARHKGLDLELDVPDDAAVLADPDLLHQVITNLVDNAIKFTLTGSIRVSARPSGDDVVLSVSDTGPGIEAVEQERIFERFYQAEDRASEGKRGAGLGLAICKAILDRHGRDIQVTSSVGVGTCFSFALPVFHPSSAGEPRYMEYSPSIQS